MDQITNENHKINTIVIEEPDLRTSAAFLEPHFFKEIQVAINSMHPLKKYLMQMGIGKLYIGHYKKEIWKAPLPFYAWKCGDCGAIAFGYPQGYKNDLYCNYCSTSEL